MSSRVEILGFIVKELKYVHWVEHAYNIINLSFIGTYESLDDFLWETSIEATNLLLPSLDLGSETHYTKEQVDTLLKLVANKIALKSQYCLTDLALNYGR